MGAPLGWGGKNGVGDDIDVTSVRQKYTQAWGNREQFDSLKVNLIGGLMGLLCAFIGFMDFTSNFVPEEHPLIESCNIKAILRSLVVKVLCPCISPKKKKLEPENVVAVVAPEYSMPVVGGPEQEAMSRVLSGPMIMTDSEVRRGISF